eukprot:954944-Pelagomonas_calceolata.AAC.10
MKCPASLVPRLGASRLPGHGPRGIAQGKPLSLPGFGPQGKKKKKKKKQENRASSVTTLGCFYQARR